MIRVPGVKTHVGFRRNRINVLFLLLCAEFRPSDPASRSSRFLSPVQLLPLEEELRQCRGEQQEAQQRCRQLEKRAEELEERNAAALGERERHVKVLEARLPPNSTGRARSCPRRVQEEPGKTQQESREGPSPPGVSIGNNKPRSYVGPSSVVNVSNECPSLKPKVRNVALPFNTRPCGVKSVFRQEVSCAPGAICFP